MTLYSKAGYPSPAGLYHPGREHEACGLAFIANIKGQKSHQIVKDGLDILCNLTHRGAAGADPRTGDGAGILLQTPDAFFRAVLDFTLPDSGTYSAGNVFLPRDHQEAEACVRAVEEAVRHCGLEVLGWRTPPTDNSCLGEGSGASEPGIRQIFVGQGSSDPQNFDILLYRARRRAEKEVAADRGLQQGEDFYICSLHSKTMVYKGMFLSDQLPVYYPDLQDERMVSAVAMVHQRFSTNTFPSWKLAHPYRYISHNGEVNTIQGNINQMLARQHDMESDDFGEDGLQDILPVIPPGLSDSASFDAALELMLHTGRSLQHVMAMMIPEAWGSRKHMNEDKKDFYLYHSNLMEPWDGPAALAAFDGRRICAILDRNGLRPARFCLTNDDRVIFGSEAGMLHIPEEIITYKSRLWPGKMIMVDIEEGVFMEDDEVKGTFINGKPYSRWLRRGMVTIDDLPDPVKPPKSLRHEVDRHHRMFGYTEEELREHIGPMALNGQEPVGAMGNDKPLAVLSDLPRPLFDFFRQKFAQVTNPAIDPIREEMVMGISSYFGSQWNVFEDGPDYCHQVKLNQPFLTNYDLEKLAQTRTKFLRGVILPITMQKDGGAAGLKEALERLFRKAEEKISLGYNAIILSDRNVDEGHMAMPSLLVVAGLHHHLIRKGLRGNLGLIVETGEARLTHHMAVLLGYGANAINPYLAFESIRDMRDREMLPARDGNEDDYEDPCAHYDRNYIKALGKGLMKVMSKMGISTLRSYRGAQIFEAIGLSRDLVNEYFSGTISQLDGIGLEEIHQASLMLHEKGFRHVPDFNRIRDWGGDHRWRPDGERHLFNPETIALLQHAVNAGDYPTFKKYSAKIDQQARKLSTLRGMFRMKPGAKGSIPLEEVEPVANIVKRFCTGAMSLGSLSSEAHETLAIAMNRLGGKSNTGEGGEDPRRFTPDANGDRRRSAIKQVASGRFGVTTEYLVNADELQIKVAQGAKPGEGGQLPGHKVSTYIASLRHSIPGVTLISPPPHHDIYSIEDLAQLIHDLKNVNPEADVSVKLVSEFGVGTVAAGVAKAHAEGVIIAGHDGGTGASPVSSIHHAGTPWELGVSETHQTLVINNLRDRIRVQTDGQLKTGRDVVIATLLGAEEYGFATTALVAEGCIMMRKCHMDTCPVGIATQNEELRSRFAGKVEAVMNFMNYVAEEVREYMAELGFRSINEMVGHTECLEVDTEAHNWKSHRLDMEKILHKVEPAAGTYTYSVNDQDHGLRGILDEKLLSLAAPAFENGSKVEENVEVRSKNRTVGTMLSGRLVKKYGRDGLPEGTIRFNFSGTAGQSFGAFLAPGIAFHLRGEANDYLGKGMSGGTIVVRPPDSDRLVSDENWIAGNTLLYGATGGKVFLSGQAGERFAVRNSGVDAVVEGLGDHGCEYMTGGSVVVLGHTGRNFAAGMSGGVAYVLDEDRLFSRRCNPGMVDIEQVPAEDEATLKGLIEEHLHHTGSKVAGRLLNDWENVRSEFVRVMPREYRKVLDRLEKKKKSAGV